MIELTLRFWHMLSKKIKRRNLFTVEVISIDMDIVADGVCGPESVNPAWDQKIFRYDSLKQLICIVEKFARLFADLRVIENRRVTAAQLPRMEKRRPIDVRNKITQRDCDPLGSACRW